MKDKVLIFIGLMLVSGCAITPETTKRIARENARFNDRICAKINELRKKVKVEGIEFIELEDYVIMVNKSSKTSTFYLKCEK
jgi:hypothetical protein